MKLGVVSISSVPGQARAITDGGSEPVSTMLKLFHR